MKHNLKYLLLAWITLASSAAYGQGTFTTDTTTAPVFDGADQGYFNPNMPSTAGGRDKWFYENSGAGQPKGQSFTTTGDISVKAVTYRLGSTNKPPTCNYLVRLGVIDTATNIFYPLHSETITQSIDWGLQGITDNAYGTWTLDTPVELPGLPTGTVYGFDITFTSNTTGWQSGIPYPLYENSDVFAGGARFTAPLGGSAGIPTNNLQIDSGRDREFHIDMDAVTIVDAAAPSLTSIDDGVSGGPIYEDQTQVKYTLVFDEAIDHTTIDITDFENLGSGVSLDSVVSVTSTTPFPVASVVEVVFGISGTGTLNLGLASTSDITDYYTNTINSPVADDTTITVMAGVNPNGGTRYWDGPTTTGITDGVSQGGTATWDTSTTNWDPGFGFAGPIAWNNSNNDAAIFGGSAGTVSLATDITLNRLETAEFVNNYQIGDPAEDNVLNFTGVDPTLVVNDATGTVITPGITGSPDVSYISDNGNNNSILTLAPVSPNTMTLGDIAVTRTNGNSRIDLGGDSSGNTATGLTWTNTNNQLFVGKVGTGSWTIGGDMNIDDGRLYVQDGTLTISGTDNYFSHKMGVNTNVGSNYTASGGSAKLIIGGLLTIGDNREWLVIQSGGTLAPVGTLDVDWIRNNGDDAKIWFQNGSTYEWELGAANASDVINITETGSQDNYLQIDATTTLKVVDVGGTPLAGDQLTVFTYDAGVTTPDTATLNANMTIDISGTTYTGTPSLVNDGAGTIYITGISSGVTTPLFDTWAATGSQGAVTFDGDTNGDGVQDGIAFLLGVANPDNDANGNLPTVSEDGSGNLVMVFNCLATADRGTAQLRVGHSNTLAAFTATADVVPDADGTDTDGKVSYVIDTVSEAPLNKVTATIDSSVASGGKLFGRLQAAE